MQVIKINYSQKVCGQTSDQLISIYFQADWLVFVKEENMVWIVNDFFYSKFQSWWDGGGGMILF